MPDRAQSESVAAVLLVGVVVISVGIVGLYAVEEFASTTDGPRTDVAVDVRTDALVVTHRGGASIPSADLRLIVRVNGSDAGLAWGDGSLDGGDDVFDPGESWRVSRSDTPDSVVVVRLVHTPSNTVLVRTETNPRVPETVDAKRGGKIEARDSEGPFVPGGRGDETGGEEPPLRVRVDDLTNRDTNNPRYVVSYDVSTTNGSFDRVEVEFDSGWNAESGTRTDETARGRVSFRGGYGQNEPYTITVRTYYETGGGATTVGRTRTITDRADTYNPENDDLRTAESPSLATETSIGDLSVPDESKVCYRFDYDVDAPGDVDEVILGTVARSESNAGTAVETVSQPSGERDVGVQYGTGTQYKAVVLITDTDGAVVDSRTRDDVADGDSGQSGGCENEGSPGKGPPKGGGPPGRR